MTTRRGVSRGRLRVDAARAVAKLREFQLADPNVWLQEVVRGAIALGATAVQAHGDADDLYVSWDEGLVDARVLPRLFDELVNASGGARGRGLRLLATGVNAALGVSPRWVMLYRCQGEACHRVSFSPELLLDADGDGRSALAELQLTEAERPEHAPQRGMFLHFRRSLSVHVVSAFISGRESSELSALRTAAEDSKVPIQVGESTSDRERSSADLVRVELGEGLDGFLAVTRVGTTPELTRHSILTAAELGVHIVSRTEGFVTSALPRAAAPLRLFVNAPRMPTNAARSDVRSGDPPVADAIDRARAVLPTLVQHLVDGLDAGGESWRRAGLALLAFAVAGADFRDQLRNHLPEALTPLLDAPLLRDAAGRPVSPRMVAKHGEVVHLEAEPVDAAVADLLKGILWLPKGDAAWALLGGTLPASAADIVDHAYRERAARVSWLERAPANVPLVTAGQVWATIELKEPELPQGARLELRLTGGREQGVSLRKEGREIEHVKLELGLGVSAALDYDELGHTTTYDGAVRNVAYRWALDWTSLGALLACEEVATRYEAGDPELLEPDGAAGRVARTLRLAVGVLGRQRRRKEPRKGLNRLLAQLDKGALMRSRIWPRAQGQWSSTLEILGSLKVGSTWVTCDERYEAPTELAADVLSMDAASIDALSSAMSGRGGKLERRLVRYTPRVAASTTARAHAATKEALQHGVVALTVEEDARRGAVAWGVEQSFVAWQHLGQSLDGQALKTATMPAFFVVDDDRALPDELWVRAAIRPPTKGLDEWERGLACAIADAITGIAPAGLKVRGGRRVRDAGDVKALLLLGLSRAESASELLGASRLDALLHAALIPLLGGTMEVSILDWARLFPDDDLPYVTGRASAGPRVHGYTPALLTHEVAEAAARLVGRDVQDAGDELKSRRLQARHEAGRALLHQRPALPLEPPTDRPHVTLRRGKLRGYVSLPGPTGEGTELRVEGRRLAMLPGATTLPVWAVVDGDILLADDDVRGLRKGREGMIGSAVAEAAGRLLLKMTETSAELVTGDARARALLMAWLEQEERSDAVLDGLRHASFMPSVQGPMVSLKEATYKGRVRSARYGGEWIECEEGRKRSSLDRPVLRVPEEGASASLRGVVGARQIIALLAGDRPITDSTRSVRKLQSQRRVAAGRVARPTLRFAQPEFAFDLSELGSGGKDLISALGPGAGALVSAGRSRLRLFSEGEEVMTLEGELYPAVELAVEAPALIDRQRKSGVKGQFDSRLRKHMTRAMGLLTTATLRRVKGDLPPWLETQLRYGVAEGTLKGALLKQPLYRTTADERVSFKRLKAQAETYGDLWVTADLRCTDVPLDEARIALRLPTHEAQRLGRRLPLTSADDLLARDAGVRRCLLQAPLATFEPDADERDAVLALRALPDSGDGVSGLVAPLTPEASDKRGMRVFRTMRPLESWRDPAAWPTLAWLDHPSLMPTTTGDDAHWGETREGLRAVVRQASEDALAEMLQPPPGALAWRRVQREEAHRMLGEWTEIRGMLFLDDNLNAGSFRVTGPDFELHLTPRRAGGETLPVSGRLLTLSAGVPAAQGAVNALAVGMCDELLGDLADQTLTTLSNTDADMSAELDHSLALLATGALRLQVTGSRLMELPLPCLMPPGQDMRALPKWQARQVQLEVLTPARAGSYAGLESAIIDDESELSSVLIAAMGRRGAGGERDTFFVICERLNLVLKSAGVAEGWLPLRPGERPQRDLVFVDSVRGTFLNESAKPVRRLAAAMEAGDARAPAALAQLALYAWAHWAHWADSSGDDAPSAERLLQACDEADWLP